MSEQTDVAVGTRLRCDSCGSEAIITQPGTARLSCCDAPLTVIFDGSKK
ncbi:hypothetical protein [Jatrophihabitans endophyticus]|nr:hypothetical protein [Jatrophihabitans endophyticus]MBE7190526.1 hypothetical protein [Jatrophihabitans endophyticus]